MKKYMIYITKYNFKEDRYEEISFKYTTNQIEYVIGYILDNTKYHIVKIDYEEITKK